VDLIGTYHDLMAALDTLPDEIAACQRDLDAYRETLADVKADAESLERHLLREAGGYSKLGSNDGERKTALALLLERNADYREMEIAEARQQGHVTALTTELDHLTRQYGAVCYKARLHAALLNYLGSAGAPVQMHGKVEVADDAIPF